MRQLAELGQGDSELALGGGELALERRIAAAKLPAREPTAMLSVSRRCCAPSQVALELPALRVGGRDEPRARETQPFELRAAKHAGARARSRVERPRRSLREPWVVEQTAAVHEHGDLAATGHHARGDAVGITRQGRGWPSESIQPGSPSRLEQPARGRRERPQAGLETARRGEAPRSTTSRASAEARAPLTRSQTTPAATSASAAISPTTARGPWDRWTGSRAAAVQGGRTEEHQRGGGRHQHGRSDAPARGENRARRPQASTAGGRPDSAEPSGRAARARASCRHRS